MAPGGPAAATVPPAVCVAVMQRRRLAGTDLELPAVGFGAAPLGGEYGDVGEREAGRVVRAAVESGIDFFDTSPYYGRTLSESRLGRALAGLRSDVILSTKAGRYDRYHPGGFDFSGARITASIDESLRRLRTDYVDILFLHDIEFGEAAVIFDESLPALEEVKASGKARFVGVSGYPLDVLAEVVETGAVDVVLSYCHGDLLDDSIADSLIPLARARGCGVLSASPLHMGLLSPSGPPSWHPAGPERRRAAEALIERCDALGVPVVAAALSYALGVEGVASVLAGFRSVGEFAEATTAVSEPVDPGILAALVAAREPFGGKPWPSGIR